MYLLQNCFIPSKFLLQGLKFDIACDECHYRKLYEISKRDPCVVGANGSFYPNFAPPAASQAVIFSKILHVGYI